MTDLWLLNGVAADEVGWRLRMFPDAWPAKRGQDVTVARRHGTVFRPKFYGPRTLSFVVEVLDVDRFGRTSPAVFWSNVDRLKGLLATDRVVLERRVRQPDGTMRTRFGTFEVVSAPQVDPAREGRHGTLSWDGLFADPFLYSPPASVSGQSGQFIINHLGNVATQRVKFSVHGPATNPTLTNASASTAVTFDGTISAGDRVDLDAGTFEVTDQDGVSVAGQVERTSVRFVELVPGINRLELSDGVCDLTWEAAFL